LINSKRPDVGMNHQAFFIYFTFNEGSSKNTFPVVLDAKIKKRKRVAIPLFLS